MRHAELRRTLECEHRDVSWDEMPEAHFRLDDEAEIRSMHRHINAAIAVIVLLAASLVAVGVMG